MPTNSSQPHTSHLTGSRLRTRLALYAAAAALLFLFERLIPNPLPWVRLGLANIVTVIVLFEHGVLAAAVVVGLRLALGGFFGGALFGPQFILGVAGGLASWLVMSVAYGAGRRHWSPLGISVLGAAAHSFAQLLAVAVVFAGGRGILSLLPVFLGLSLVTGIITGWLADVMLRRLSPLWSRS